jgi:hypothetical protein
MRCQFELKHNYELAPKAGESDNMSSGYFARSDCYPRLDDITEDPMSPIAHRPMPSSLLTAA